MKYVDAFRDPALGKNLLREIERLVNRIGRAPDDPIKLMEVCGGHTHTISRFGLEAMLPDALELIHGPGCPVCVLPVGRVDDAIAIAIAPNVIFTTFGDAIRVPGSKGSLLQARATGADVRTVYSPMDALEIARQNPERRVVFFALGFETTAPATALTLRDALTDDVKNFFVLSNHITIVPTLKAILNTPELKLDGFIGPGHVSMVIGIEPYRFISAHYGKPLVVSGFEPLDILHSIVMLLEQLASGRCAVENQYQRVVAEGGNPVAQEVVAQVFELREHFEWRGLGSIDHSGLRLTAPFARFDAEREFTVPALSIADPKACQCGEVLTGALKPWECKVFGTACTPTHPIGACMVSSEGACAAHYNYGRIKPRAEKHHG